MRCLINKSSQYWFGMIGRIWAIWSWILPDQIDIRPVLGDIQHCHRWLTQENKGKYNKAWERVLIRHYSLRVDPPEDYPGWQWCSQYSYWSGLNCSFCYPQTSPCTSWVTIDSIIQIASKIRPYLFFSFRDVSPLARTSLVLRLLTP